MMRYAAGGLGSRQALETDKIRLLNFMQRYMKQPKKTPAWR